MTDTPTSGDAEPTYLRIPAPETVSEAAQAMLNAPVNLTLVTTVPQSDDEWRGAQAANNGAMQPMVDGMKAGMPVTVEQSEIAGVTVRTVTPNDQSVEKKDRILINPHGGAYVFFGGDATLLEAIPLAVATGYTVISPDYRVPPDHPFPAAIDDVVSVYRALLETTPADKVGIYGSSSGAALGIVSVLKAREQGAPTPAALALNTPWSELGKVGDSYKTNQGLDPIAYNYDGGLAAAAKLYADGVDMKDPLLSPVYADYSGEFPPSIIISGTRDLFLSNAVRQHRAFRAAGVRSELHVFEAMWHGFFGVPETNEAMSEITTFLDGLLLN